MGAGYWMACVARPNGDNKHAVCLLRLRMRCCVLYGGGGLRTDENDAANVVVQLAVRHLLTHIHSGLERKTYNLHCAPPRRRAPLL